jgi:probable F420-dependent oxidoreductase
MTVFMKFCATLHSDKVELGDEFVSGAGITAAAQAAEKAGFDVVYVTEHPFPSDDWLNDGGHHALDPFVTLAFAGAATSQLKLMTHLCVVPYHNPYLLAKTIVTLDVLSGGRVIFGCGAGYLEAEFKAVGMSFEDRNDRFEASIVAMKEAWTRDSVAVEASGVTHTLQPRPRQRPHPPIWMGGNTRRALRRAVQLGDGWDPFLNRAGSGARNRTAELYTLEDLASRLDEMHELEAELGRTIQDVMFSPVDIGSYGSDAWDTVAFYQIVEKYESLGVTTTLVYIPAQSRREYCDLVATFGTDVLQKYGTA